MISVNFIICTISGVHCPQSGSISLLQLSKTGRITAHNTKEDALIVCRDILPGHTGPQLIGRFILGKLNSAANCVLAQSPSERSPKSMAVASVDKRLGCLLHIDLQPIYLPKPSSPTFQRIILLFCVARGIILLHLAKTCCISAGNAKEDALVLCADVRPGHTGPQLTGALVFGQLNVDETERKCDVSANSVTVCWRACFSSTIVSASSRKEITGIRWQRTTFRFSHRSSAHFPCRLSSASISTQFFGLPDAQLLYPSRCIPILNCTKIGGTTSHYAKKDTFILGTNIFPFSVSLLIVCNRLCFNSRTVSASSFNEVSGAFWQTTKFFFAHRSSNHLPTEPSSACIDVNCLQPRRIVLLHLTEAGRFSAGYTKEDALVATGDIRPGHAGPQLTGRLIFGQLDVGETKGNGHRRVLLQLSKLRFSVRQSVFQLDHRTGQQLNGGQRQLLADDQILAGARLIRPPAHRVRVAAHLHAVVRMIFGTPHRPICVPSGGHQGVVRRPLELPPSDLLCADPHILSKTGRISAHNSKEDAFVVFGDIRPGHTGPQLTGRFIFGQLNTVNNLRQPLLCSLFHFGNFAVQNFLGIFQFALCFRQSADRLRKNVFQFDELLGELANRGEWHPLTDDSVAPCAPPLGPFTLQAYIGQHLHAVISQVFRTSICPVAVAAQGAVVCCPFKLPISNFGQRLTLTTLGHCERPPTRAPLAPLARPESVDVHSAQVSSDLAALGCGLLLFLHIKQRLTSDLARSAREALVGGRFW
ncbi:hypothetical protein TYRP_015287 [Tyrophagus putrescentiae]|nr:hypothetical protein TYRP_015287 [Tyrophagus putrescentiae]